MKRFQLSRRTFLQGTGAAVALPTLEAMLNSHGVALADGTPLPRRLATFFWGNGVILREWVPRGTGADWQLSRALAPLSNVKEYVSVVSGYMVKTPNRRGHHNGAAGILSGHPFIPQAAGGAPYSSKFGGPSIDQVAAARIGKGTRFPSLEVAVSKRIVRGEGPTLQFISHKGPDQPMPQEFNPAALFNRLFGSSQPPPAGQQDPRAQLRVSVLDAVKDDARRLSGRLGSADRARLDAHLTGVSELRQQLLALPPEYTAACTKPTPVTQDNRDVSGREPMELVSKAMADLVTLAWACDLTRVASFMFSGSVGGHVFHMLGQTRGNHDLTHDSGAQTQVADSVVWVMRQFAYWLERLKATPDAGGNLLDNSCILASSDVAEGLPHSITDYPILVAGRAGGYLRSPGIHVRSSNSANTSDVLLTCLKAVGTGVSSVGSGTGYSDAECTAIKA